LEQSEVENTCKVELSLKEKQQQQPPLFVLTVAKNIDFMERKNKLNRALAAWNSHRGQ